MEVEYLLTDDSLEVRGLDLTSWRHKNSVYLGSFYVKELRESKGVLYADIVSGDKTLLNYRDSIHEMHVGWKTPLVELISSFMKVAYLVSRGVIYQPFEEPENYIYNVNRHRLQVVGRYDSTIKYIDEDFLDWVMEFIGFTISEERPNQFGYLTHNEYYDKMDKDHKELYKGYLQCKDFQELVEYTLEPSVMEVLEEYVPITRFPIDNKPTLRGVLEKSVEEKEKQLQEEKERQESIEEDLASEPDKDIDYDTARVLREKEHKKKKSSKQTTVGNSKEIEAYRKHLGIPDDKDEYATRRKGSGVIPMVFSLISLGLSLWLLWEFVTWLMV